MHQKNRAATGNNLGSSGIKVHYHLETILSIETLGIVARQKQNKCISSGLWWERVRVDFKVGETYVQTTSFLNILPWPKSTNKNFWKALNAKVLLSCLAFNLNFSYTCNHYLAQKCFSMWWLNCLQKYSSFGAQKSSMYEKNAHTTIILNNYCKSLFAT